MSSDAVKQESSPVTCTENNGILTQTWQNTFPNASFTFLGDITDLNYYFGSDNDGVPATPIPDFTLDPGLTSSGTNKYFLRVARSSDPGTVWTCFEDWYDSEAPDIASAYATVSGISSDVWQNTVFTPDFSIIFSDHGSGITEYYLYFGTDPEGTSGDPIAGTPGSFSPGTQVDDVYYLRASGVDSLGYVSSWGTLFIFKLDTLSPADPVYPAATIPEMDEAGYHNDPSPHFDWLDADGATHYQIYWGSDPLGEDITETVAVSEYVPSTPLASSGTYYLRVRSVDEAGNLGSQFVTLFTYRFDAEGPDGVTGVTETNGLPGGVCQSDTRNASFTWLAPDPPGGAPIAAYDYYWGEEPDGMEVTGSTVEPALSLSVPHGGKYYLRLSVRDSAGNTSSWNTVFAFCHGDKVATFTPTDEGSMGTSVPEPLSVFLTVTENSYSEDYYLRLVYPSGISVPEYNPAPPLNHGSFRIYADKVSDLSTITSLDQGITITFHYPEESVLALLEDTLAIYKYVDGEWQVIKNSVVDIENNTVTAGVNSFGDFIVMGTPVPEHERLQVKFCQVQFPKVRLSGTKQTVDSIVCPWTILDARYNDAGWHVTIEATDFENPDGQIIPRSFFAVQVPQDTITREAGTETPNSLVKEHTPFVEGGLNIISMSEGASGGRFIIRPRFQLEIPAETYEGAYQSTLTITIISGPS